MTDFRIMIGITLLALGVYAVLAAGHYGECREHGFSVRYCVLEVMR